MHNINPKIWGPPAWDFLFYVAIAYPDNPTQENKDSIKQFLYSLEHILPCEKCRYNYNGHIKSIKMDDNILNTRYDLLIWLVDVHNKIRAYNGKKPRSYDEIIKKYTNQETCVSYTMIIIIVTIILILVLAGTKLYFR